MIRIVLTLSLALLSACHSEIYVRDGVTDGDKFHVSTEAMLDDDPVQQSWAAYSIAKSVCQLEIGGSNPARANSYGCELSSRNILLDTWAQLRSDDPHIDDEYLNTLAVVREAAFLEEYVVRYFGEKNWFVPAELEKDAFQIWRRKHLKGHRPYTQIVGSWSYAEPQTDNN